MILPLLKNIRHADYQNMTLMWMNSSEMLSELCCDNMVIKINDSSIWFESGYRIWTSMIDSSPLVIRFSSASVHLFRLRYIAHKFSSQLKVEFRSHPIAPHLEASVILYPAQRYLSHGSWIGTVLLGFELWTLSRIPNGNRLERVGCAKTRTGILLPSFTR